MTTDMLPPSTDEPDVSGSSWMLLAAIVVAACSSLGEPPINGMSLLAVALLVLAAITRRRELRGRS